MADADESQKAEEAAFAGLTGKFKHYCSDWDGMAIDETCHEFTGCYCYDGTTDETEVNEIKEVLNDTCERCNSRYEHCTCQVPKIEDLGEGNGFDIMGEDDED